MLANAGFFALLSWAGARDEIGTGVGLTIASSRPVLLGLVVFVVVAELRSDLPHLQQELHFLLLRVLLAGLVLWGHLERDFPLPDTAR